MEQISASTVGASLSQRCPYRLCLPLQGQSFRLPFQLTKRSIRRRPDNFETRMASIPLPNTIDEELLALINPESKTDSFALSLQVALADP